MSETTKVACWPRKTSCVVSSHSVPFSKYFPSFRRSHQSFLLRVQQGVQRETSSKGFLCNNELEAGRPFWHAFMGSVLCVEALISMAEKQSQQRFDYATLRRGASCAKGKAKLWLSRRKISVWFCLERAWARTNTQKKHQGQALRVFVMEVITVGTQEAGSLFLEWARDFLWLQVSVP